VPATATPLAPDAPPGAARPAARRRLQDNPRLILAGIGVLVSLLAAIAVAVSRTPRLTPDFLSEVVLYALLAADLTMLAALAFVLARNIIKLIVERRRALPFARFRAKLVAALLSLTIVPSVLVLIAGTEFIRTSIDNWFNAPMEDILSSANQVAGDFYRERQLRVADQARRLARELAAVDLARADAEAVRALLAPEAALERVGMVQVFRPVPGRRAVEPVAAITAATIPSGSSQAAERLAVRALAGQAATDLVEPLGTAGDLLRSAAVVPGRDGRPAGVIVATDHLAGDLAARSRRMTRAYENYTQLRVLKRPLTGVYLSFFLMVTLLILVGSTWMGLYLAKGITRPVQMLAAAAREIGAGHLDQRVEPQSNDEFGALVEAFNAMAGDLAASRRKVDHARAELERKHQEVEARRRYVETVLDRITTGVVSVDAAGTITTINGAAARLLDVPRSSVGRPVRDALDRPELQAVTTIIDRVLRGGEPPAQEFAIAREGHEIHLAAEATALAGEGGAPEGAVLVLDDVTPLIRAQKIAAWREVARRLAHEIKNPLTPIQLCAERLRRHFAGAPAPVRALVEECTATIVGEVESLKGLVDEFSQFARMPAPKAVATDLPRLIADTLRLYQGLFAEVRIEQRGARGIPLVRLDPEQIRRVIINLIDNAIEAMHRRGTIVVETELDGTNRLVRLIVADDGPGIPPAERDKLFLPYYSTKRRGSGLGLAIVRRIIAEHGGSIEVGDQAPRGTRFTIELPCGS